MSAPPLRWAIGDRCQVGLRSAVVEYVAENGALVRWSDGKHGMVPFEDMDICLDPVKEKPLAGRAFMKAKAARGSRT